MPDKAQQNRRTNRVFKSLHKPLTYLGVERTLFYFVCVGAVGAFNLFNSILAGIAVFIGGFAFGHWVTNSDPAFLRRLHAQLPDGSRIAAWIPPLVSPAPAIAIRKFTSRNYTVDDLIARGTLTQPIADLLAEQIRSGKTLLISGGTGTGKTTLLRILANSIPENERILVIEDNNSFPPLCGLANTQSSSVGYGLCSRQFHKTLDSRKSSGTGLREASVLQSPTCCITIERMGCCRRFTLSLDKICYQE
jgi:hypothetical protein